MGAIPIFGTDGAQRRASGTRGTRRARIPMPDLGNTAESKTSLKRLSILQGCISVLKTVETLLNGDLSCTLCPAIPKVLPPALETLPLPMPSEEGP